MQTNIIHFAQILILKDKTNELKLMDKNFPSTQYKAYFLPLQQKQVSIQQDH